MIPIVLHFVLQDSNNVEMISSSDCNCLIKCLSRQCYEMYCCDLINPDELECVHVSKVRNSDFVLTDFVQYLRDSSPTFLGPVK